MLIAGWLEGKYTGVRYVHATGQVMAKVWYSKKEKVYYKQNERKQTGNVEKKYSINIKNFAINFYKKLSKFEIYDTIKAKLAGNVVLTAFPAFSVTNLLLVQCSSAVLQCSYGCIRAHPFPLIYAP